MKLSTIFSAILLATTIQTPLQALANTIPMCDNNHSGSIGGVSSPSPWTDPLGAGDYAFSESHSAGSVFFEELTFSVATSSDVSISIIDVSAPVTALKNASALQFSNMLGNKYLTLSLFDNTGQWLGSVGSGGILNALSLATGSDYVLTISGKASGMYGGIYAGNLSIAAISEVPLSTTAPLFGSALLILIGRARKVMRGSSSN